MFYLSENKFTDMDAEIFAQVLKVSNLLGFLLFDLIKGVEMPVKVFMVLFIQLLPSVKTFMM